MGVTREDVGRPIGGCAGQREREEEERRGGLSRIQKLKRHPDEVPKAAGAVSQNSGASSDYGHASRPMGWHWPPGGFYSSKCFSKRMGEKGKKNYELRVSSLPLSHFCHHN